MPGIHDYDEYFTPTLPLFYADNFRTKKTPKVFPINPPPPPPPPPPPID